MGSILSVGVCEMKLNLGAADRHVDGFLSVDIAQSADGLVDQIVNLEGLWPWPDSSVDEVIAYDVCEHIGDCDHITSLCLKCVMICAMPEVRRPCRVRHPLGRIHFMNELHRVLLPGSRATIETPDAAKGAGYYQDPTHKTPWTRNSFQYYGAGPGGEFAHGRLSKSYGITAKFKLISLDEREYQDTFDKVWKITAVLEAVK